jgi:hypothetical protein
MVCNVKVNFKNNGGIWHEDFQDIEDKTGQMAPPDPVVGDTQN